MSILVKPAVIDLIKEKYRIVEIIDLINYDTNLKDMDSVLSKYANVEFENDQRLIILHHETDYYQSLNSVGNTIYNFLSLCSEYLIPLEKIIFLTNHYGLREEISHWSKQICNDVLTNVIETAQWFDFPDDAQVLETTYSYHTDYLFCCLNNKKRKNRLLTLCMLKEQGLIGQGMLSYHFGD